MSISSIQATEQKNLPNLKRMSRDAFKTNQDSTCFCSSSPAELNYERGLEVSAVLHHGSYIRFGCLQFVFSILTYENEDLKEELKEQKSTTENNENNEIKEEEKDIVKTESEEM